jgi:hypothetical protein
MYSGTGEASRPETENVPKDCTTYREVSQELLVGAQKQEDDLEADSPVGYW